MVSWLHTPAEPAPFPAIGNGSTDMLHKTLLDTLSDQAARLLNSSPGQPAADIERQLKALVQSALGKLDVVSREEFETQQLVLMRTRERLEALEKRVAELEPPPTPCPGSRSVRCPWRLFTVARNW